jgi:hypothetical protein
LAVVYHLPIFINCERKLSKEFKMTTVLLCLVAVATAIAIWAATLYFGRCEELEHHRSTDRPNSNDDEAGALAWKHKDWELENQRMRTGITGLVAYGIGMSAAIPANSMFQAAENASNLPIVLIGVLCLSLLAISLRSLKHSDRILELSLARKWAPPVVATNE